MSKELTNKLNAALIESDDDRMDYDMSNPVEAKVKEAIDLMGQAVDLLGAAAKETGDEELVQKMFELGVIPIRVMRGTFRKPGSLIQWIFKYRNTKR